MKVHKSFYIFIFLIALDGYFKYLYFAPKIKKDIHKCFT